MGGDDSRVETSSVAGSNDSVRVVPDVRLRPPRIVLQHARNQVREALFGRVSSGQDGEQGTGDLEERPNPLDRGGTLGRYVVLGPLGHGGMGTVVKAYDESLDRAVALKLLHTETAERHARRLQREAQALARLSHPHVVHVYEVGEADGQWFIAMELVLGQTLRQWQRGEHDWRDAVRVYLQAGEGLRAAHAEGLVHRDFKPDNCIIDERGRVRVLDFGLVRDVELGSEELLQTRTSVEVDSLTRTGAVLGTLAYMPLEQLEGRPVDARSDQFGFCVSLYEAVYGERPYAGSTMADLEEAIRGKSLRPAPRGSAVPLALRKVLLRGLATDADARWPSMEGLLRELRRLVAPTGRRGMAVAVIGGLALLGGGVALGLYAQVMERCTGAAAQLEEIWDDARRQELEAALLGTGVPYAADTWERVDQRLTARAEAWAAKHTEVCRATRVTQEQSEEEMGLRMGCLRERKRDLRSAVGVLAKADATVVRKAVALVAGLPRLSSCDDLEALRNRVPPPEDPAVAREVQGLRDRIAQLDVELDAGRFIASREETSLLVERAKALGYPPIEARAKLQRGIFLHADGQDEQAEQDLLEAYELAIEHDDDDVAFVAARELTHVVGHSLARPVEGRVWGRTAVAQAKGRRDEVELASSLNAMGLLLKIQGQYEQAEEHHMRALQLVETALGDEHPFGALCLNNLGNVVSARGDDEGARRYYERALRIQQRAQGPRHPELGLSLGNLGVAAFAEGEYEQARRYYERALQIFEAAFSEAHPDIGGTLANLGNVSFSLGDTEGARRYYARALPIFEQTLGADHPGVGQLLSNLTTILHGEGEHEQALLLGERSLRIREKALGPEHNAVADSLSNVARVLRSQEKYAQAKRYYERALRIREKALGPEHHTLAYALVGLAEVALVEGDPGMARVHAERAVSMRAKALVAPDRQAEAQFVLARALWSDPAQRDRAREMAQRARDARATLGVGQDDELAELDRWLSEHPGSAP